MVVESNLKKATQSSLVIKIQIVTSHSWVWRIQNSLNTTPGSPTKVGGKNFTFSLIKGICCSMMKLELIY